jgi:hypothetical protein
MALLELGIKSGAEGADEEPVQNCCVWLQWKLGLVDRQGSVCWFAWWCGGLLSDVVLEAMDSTTAVLCFSCAG